MKKILKLIGKVLLVLVIVAALAAVLVYFFVLRYPEIRENPETGKWYRVSAEGMKDSEGGRYHALFKKGSENKVLIVFAGGGASFNEESARMDAYNTKEVWPDYLANATMNMGGIASDVEGSPFQNWTKILFPYATGDFHAGTGEYPYTDTDGKEKILYHNGYTNYQLAMEKIMKTAGIEQADTVLVNGYSAGGFAAGLLADDIYTKYFPEAESKNVWVDASLLKGDWSHIVKDNWKAPESISSFVQSDNLIVDCFAHLRSRYGEGIHLMFDCSPRDGDLTVAQKILDTGKVIQYTEEDYQKPEVIQTLEVDADTFQETLKESIPIFEQYGVSLYLFDDAGWYGRPGNLTAHTISSTPGVWMPLKDGPSIGSWVNENMKGKKENHGLALVNQTYEKTEF
jgi:hypothetical protein